MYSIYKITNNKNNHIYVGQTKLSIEQRFKNHLKNAKKGINRYLYNAMNYYGYENFVIEILEEDVSNPDEREIYWIEKLDTFHNGYNMTPGGGGGYTIQNWSEEKKLLLWKQQSEKRKGRPRTEEDKIKIGDGNRGKKRTKELKAQISVTNKELGISPPDYTKWKPGEEGAFKGYSHSESSKELMRKFRLGKTYEELYGIEKATELKEKRRQSCINNNPNRKDKCQKIG